MPDRGPLSGSGAPSPPTLRLGPTAAAIFPAPTLPTESDHHRRQACDQCRGSTSYTFCRFHKDRARFVPHAISSLPGRPSCVERICTPAAPQCRRSHPSADRVRSWYRTRQHAVLATFLQKGEATRRRSGNLQTSRFPRFESGGLYHPAAQHWHRRERGRTACGYRAARAASSRGEMKWSCGFSDAAKGNSKS